MKHVLRHALLVLAATLVLLCSQTGAWTQTWTDVDIGSPTVAGSSSYSNGVLTVTGAGTGDTTAWYQSDQLHYVYQLNAGGDIDIIARVAAFSGPAHARAGIMLRSNNDPSNTSTAAVSFAYQDSGTDNVIWGTARDQASATCAGGQAGGTTMSPPMWIRLVRIGQHFAIYKSPDGVIWTVPSNGFGYKYLPAGQIEVGFFAAGGAAGTTCTATFDNINITTPHLGYSTSWIGNTFAGTSVAGDSYVSNGISALWTASDGSCYTNSYYDEAWGEAAKIYKDGVVVNRIWFGNDTCAEGTITGDGTSVYLAINKGIGRADLQGNNTQSMFFLTDLWDAAKNEDVVSGMAVTGNRLYISNERDNNILVAQTNVPRYFSQISMGGQLTTTQTIATTGVTHAAPMTVYQSAIGTGDNITYAPTGLTANTTYTVRCHFAEYTETQTGKRLIEIFVNGNHVVTGYDVVAAAGGQFKAAVLDIPNQQSDSSGHLPITFWPSSRWGGGGDGGAIICGIEIVKGDTTDAFAVNCGGPAVGNFLAEADELPGQGFAFTRPGPMVADSRGDLWIIQEANDFPISTTISTKYPGKILCYHTNGTFTGKQITDCVNPVALAYDAANDRLLVADNSSNQDIAIYNNLATTPTFQTSFGVTGGIYAGATPGLIYDAASGGNARFYGLTGVGIDSSGNIYVSSGLQGTDLRKFTSSGTQVWKVNGLPFCQNPGFDPDSDGQDAYALFSHYSLNYNNTAPGSEWSHTAYNWNPQLYPLPSYNGSAASIMRRLGPNRALFEFVETTEDVKIFRFSGQIAIPCGSVGLDDWIDLNGDGLETSDEDFASAGGSMGSFCVDQRGDIWLPYAWLPSTGMGVGPVLLHLFFKGLTAQGVPIYTMNPGDYETLLFPSVGATFTGSNVSLKVDYDNNRDVMYLMQDVYNPSNPSQVVACLARYNNWSTGNRTESWKVFLQYPRGSDPYSTDPNFGYELGRPWGCYERFMGMEVAVDKIFIATLFGIVKVYDANTGSLLQVLGPGPAFDGGTAWEDVQMGLSAVKRSTGEYIVCTENAGWKARVNMYRVAASGSNTAPAVSITAPADGATVNGTVVIRARATDTYDDVSKVEFYQGATLLGTCSYSPFSYTWSNPPAGNYTLTAKATDAGGLATTSAGITLHVVADAAPTVNITSPANNAIITNPPVAIPITAMATDSDGTVSKVEFYNGTTLLGTVSSSPYTFTWTNVPSGTYTVFAKAYDNANITSLSSVTFNVVLFSDPLNDGVLGSAWTTRNGTWSEGSVLSQTNASAADPDKAILSNSGVAFPTNFCVQAKLRVNTWGGGDNARVGIGLMTDGSGNAYNLVFHSDTNTVAFLYDQVVWGNSYAFTWNVGTWYWFKLKYETDGNLYGKVWQDGTSEPPNWPYKQSGWGVRSPLYPCLNGGSADTVDFSTFSVSALAALQPCAMPMFSPVAGSYATAQYVGMYANSGASIRYTTDGTFPSETAGTLYTDPLYLTTNTTVMAIAYQSGMADSPIAAATYVIGQSSCAAPSFTPVAGTYGSAQNVTITTTTTGASIRYTTDGTTPSDTVGTIYSTPVNISTNTTLKAIAYKTGYANSTVTTGVYAIQCATPSFSPVAGTYATAQNVTITTTTTGAAIRYTTDGTIPSDTVGTVYSSPVVINANCTLQAIAYKSGLTNSTVTSGAYVILAPPAPWNTADIGTVGATGSATYNAPTFTVTGAGVDIQNTADAFRYVYRQASGDTIMIARVATQQNTSGWAKAGVMMRADLTAGAANALMAVTPSNGVTSQYRTSAGGSTTPIGAGGVAPEWVKIIRTGNNFACYCSTDGSSWTQVGSTTAITMIDPIYVGLAVCSQADPTLCTATFDNVKAMPIAPVFSPAPGTFTGTQTVAISTTTSGASIRYTTDGTTPSSTVGTVYSTPITISATTTLKAVAYKTNMDDSTVVSGVYSIIPAPWSSTDIGVVGSPGSASYSAPTFTVTGSGTDIQGTADSFQFVYQQLTGDTTVIARVVTQQHTSDWAKAGVMIRQDLTTGAANALAAVSPSNGVNYQFRTTANGSTSAGWGVGAAAPEWVKVTRVGNNFATYYSSDGVTWTQAGSTTTITMTDPIYVGLAVCSQANPTLCTATFDNVSAVGTVVAPSFSPAAGTYTTSTAVTISTTTGGAAIRYTTDGTTPSDTVGTIYSTPVSISSTCTLKAIAYKSGMNNSGVTSGVYTIQCAAPSFSPAAGTYTTSTSVTITTATGGASIRYTTDGTTPSSTVGTVYSSPVSITATCTLKAIAYKTGLTNSTVTSGVYTIQCAAPTFSPAAGSYSTAQSVTISCATPGVTMRYTTDGTTPSATVGTIYSSPVSISSTTTLKAIAYKTGLSNSAVTSGVYTIYIGTTAVGSTNTAITANTMRGTRFQAGANMTVTKINLNIGTSVAGNIQCAIYTDNGGVPGTLLMGTGALSNPGTGWKTFTLTSSQALTSGTYYWILCWSAANYSVKCNTASGSSWYSSQTYGSWPSTAPSGTTETRTWSIYAY